MKARLMFVLMALTTSAAFASTTLTINTSDFTGANPVTSIRIDLQNCSNARLSGTGQIVPQTLTLAPVAGVAHITLFSNTDPANSSAIILCQTPSGQQAVSYYSFSFIYQGVITGVGSYNLIPGTFNLIDLTPCVGPACIGNGSGGVTRIIAGSNITISPTNGLGQVTINSIGGGGAGNPSAPGGSMQTANSDATQFVGTSVLDAYVFTNGGGNNGIANALATSPACAGTGSATGCTLVNPPNTSSSEDILNALNGVSQTHLTDLRFGSQIDIFHNPSSLGGQTQQNGSAQLFLWNGQPAADVGTDSVTNNDVYAPPGGFNTVGHWSVHEGWINSQTMVGRGIGQGMRYQQFCQKTGDCSGFYFTQTGNGGSFDAGGEDTEEMALDQFQAVYPQNGTVTVGSAGAMQIKATFANGDTGRMDGASVITSSDVEASGIITGLTNHAYPIAIDYATSDTHSQSTGLGFLTAPCGANVASNAPVSTVCTFTLSGGFGTLVGSSSNPLIIVCVADSAAYEQVRVTNVSGSNITLNLRYSHPSGIELFQGRPCGSHPIMSYGNISNPFVTPYPANYYIAGAKTTTSLTIINPYKQNQNGQLSIYVPAWSTSNSLPQVSASIASISRTGTTVTVTLTSQLGIFFNGRAAPAGSSICVTGNTNSAFNVCGITGVAASSQGTVLTYTQGSGSASGTGGTIQIATTAAPTVSSMASYIAACGAEATGVIDTTILLPAGDGFNLEANDCANTVGATLLQPPFTTNGFSNARLQSVASTPSTGGADVQQYQIVGGLAWSGGIHQRLDTVDLASTILGQGQGDGYIAPRTWIDNRDYLQNFITSVLPPLNGGFFVHFGAPFATAATSAYTFFQQDLTGGGSDQMVYDPVARTMTVGGSSQWNWEFNYLKSDTHVDALQNLYNGVWVGPYGSNSAYRCIAFTTNCTDGTNMAILGAGPADPAMHFRTLINGSYDFTVWNGTTPQTAFTIGLNGVSVGGTNHSIATGTASNTDLAGRVTLSGGTFTQALTGTYTTAPVVVCSDTSVTPTLVGCHTTTTQIIFNGTGTDSISYIMVGLN